MILADIATLEAIAARLRSAGEFETAKAADDIEAVLNSERTITEDVFYRLLHSVWRRVSLSLDEESCSPGQNDDLEHLEIDLARAISLHRTAGAGSLLVREWRRDRSSKNTPEV